MHLTIIVRRKVIIYFYYFNHLQYFFAKFCFEIIRMTQHTQRKLKWVNNYSFDKLHQD